MNLYLKAPLVLGGICIASAGLLGGVNLLAETMKKNQGNEAPKAIKDLDPNASFEAVADFEAYSQRGESAKVTIEKVYTILEGGNRTGYAYQLNCGKAVKSDIKFNVAYKGEITESTINDVKPYSVVAIALGDPGYDTNAGALLDGVVGGNSSMNDGSSLVTGGTVSQKYVLDGLRIARQDYLNRWNGGGGPGPVDETLTLLQGVFTNKADPDKTQEVLSYALDEEFAPVTFSYRDYNNKRKSGKIEKRYTVQLENNETAKVYQGGGKAIVSEGSAEELSVDLMVGFQGDAVEGQEKAIKPVGYNVVATDFSFNQWEGTYLPGIIDGSLSLDESGDASTGATISSQLVRQMMISARKDYYKTSLEEQAANVAADFQAWFGDQYDSFELDATFEAKQGDLTTETLTGTYNITERYNITLKDGTVAKAYKGSTEASFLVSASESSSMYATVLAGFNGENGKLVGASVKKVSSYDEWKDSYLPGLVEGDKDLDNLGDTASTGATRSAEAVRELLLAMREDYHGGQGA